MTEALPRSRRLARARDLNVVLRTGQRLRSPRLDIIWRTNGLEHPRVGVVVPRYGQTVVRRNRLRRRLREIVRRQVIPRSPPVDLVVRSRPGAYRVSTAELASDLARWTARFGR